MTPVDVDQLTSKVKQMQQTDTEASHLIEED